LPHNIILYADGSAKGNPGRGGFGAVLISGKLRKEMSCGYRLTTNNRMELLGVITGLEALKVSSCNVTVYTDSKYVADAIEKGWLQNWVKTGFKKKKNKDLWIRYLSIAKNHSVRFIWVKGHANNPENNLCDRLAVAASEYPNLLIDEWYENNKEKEELF
jgi:ribonuclease HI